MLDINEIGSFYPPELRHFKRNLLREYLQYKILEIIFESRYGVSLAFMGGTAIRILYNNDRFSEDLDFDNRGLSTSDFEGLSRLISKELTREGYANEISNSFKGAFRCNIKFNGLLHASGLSSHREEKLLIQVDTEPQRYKYQPEKNIVNKFNIFVRVNSVPIKTLLSQKIFTLFNRKRPMGRDFYDTVFLWSKTKPDFEYLREKMSIGNMITLKARLLKRANELDFSLLSRDVAPFLFNPKGVKKIVHFKEYIESLTAEAGQ